MGERLEKLRDSFSDPSRHPHISKIVSRFMKPPEKQVAECAHAKSKEADDPLLKSFAPFFAPEFKPQHNSFCECAQAVHEALEYEKQGKFSVAAGLLQETGHELFVISRSLEKESPKRAELGKLAISIYRRASENYENDGRFDHAGFSAEQAANLARSLSLPETKEIERRRDTMYGRASANPEP